MNINPITDPGLAARSAVQIMLSGRMRHPDRKYDPITVGDVEATIKAYPATYNISEGDWQAYLSDAEGGIDRVLSEVEERAAEFKFDSRESLF